MKESLRTVDQMIAEMKFDNLTDDQLVVFESAVSEAKSGLAFHRAERLSIYHDEERYYQSVHEEKRLDIVHDAIWNEIKRRKGWSVNRGQDNDKQG